MTFGDITVTLTKTDETEYFTERQLTVVKGEQVHVHALAAMS